MFQDGHAGVFQRAAVGGVLHAARQRAAAGQRVRDAGGHRGQAREAAERQHAYAELLDDGELVGALEFIAIAFIDKYGHAYISNGAFILESYDGAKTSGIVTADVTGARENPEVQVRGRLDGATVGQVTLSETAIEVIAAARRDVSS